MGDILTPGTPGFLILHLFGLAVLLNGWTFLVFGIDKRRAVKGEWRVPEATLLMLAFMGGWLGAKAAQRWFRHKTRKQPFATLLNLIGGMQVVLVLAIAATPMLRGMDGTTALATIASALAPEAEPPARTLPRRFGPGSADW